MIISRYPVLIVTMLIVASSALGASPREKISLSGPWQFCVDSASAGDAGNWALHGLPVALSRTVEVPHAWNADAGLEKYWGVCWYQRSVDISPDQLTGAMRLQFDAVYHDAVIYVNGHKAGEHTGAGYTRFFVDATRYLKAGRNTITVRADNAPSRSNIPYLKSFDWAHDGGIYRHVYLLVTERQAIRNIRVAAEPEGRKGRAGIRVSFWDTTGMSREKWVLEASVTGENQPSQAQVYQGRLQGRIEQGDFVSTLSFDNIQPWHFDAPNLYKLRVTLSVDGKIRDEYAVSFGFRSIRVENNRYVLNGEPMRLMGVEWMPGSNLQRGMAETHEDLERNLRLMKEVNCIFTRFHWQQDEYVFDWCDRHGILVQEEIPYWGGSTHLNDTLLHKGRQHLEEMIDAHYNHPSIIAWGLGNELDGHNGENIDALKVLYSDAQRLDSSRLVNYVSNSLHYGFPGEGKALPDATAAFDMMMFNEYYSTWYGKRIDVISGELDRIAREYPRKAMTISEWGICEPTHKGGDPRRAREMVQQMGIYGAKDYVAGAIYFCLNDYRTHFGEDSTYAYPQRVHGVTDIHGRPKPSFDTLKHISAPVIVKSVKASDGAVMITLQGKTGLPAYTIRHYTLQAGNARLVIESLKPGEEKTYTLKTDAREFSLFRPTGFEVLRGRVK